MFPGADAARAFDLLKEMASMAKEKDVKMIMYAFTTWGLAGKCEPLAGTALGQLTASIGTAPYRPAYRQAGSA